MPDDPNLVRTDMGSRSVAAAAAEAGDAPGDLHWWLGGGVLLLAWTAIVLLLTSA